MKHKKHKFPKLTKDSSLEKKSAEIFKAMGYEIEFNRCFKDCQIDIFIKQKKTVSSEYECWVCFCDNGNQKVRKKAINRLFHTWNIVKKELAKESDLYNDCQAMFISATGFTRGAVETADEYWIELRTLKTLRDDLGKFIKESEQLSRALEDLEKSAGTIHNRICGV